MMAGPLSPSLSLSFSLVQIVFLRGRRYFFLDASYAGRGRVFSGNLDAASKGGGRYSSLGVWRQFTQERFESQMLEMNFCRFWAAKIQSDDPKKVGGGGANSIRKR